MTYQVIARKWRPQRFEEVTGQEPITRTLRNAIEHERLHHAYIFSGSRGVGKTTTARLLAKALNCHKTDKPNPAPCSFNDADACASCLEISESRSIDVFEFDAASHTGVDDIRDLILESININPARDRFKIFIIDEVHMLSKSSFNALLKTLEEPPPRVEFIMATTELHKLPDTIVSRCQEFRFRSIPLVKINERLKTIAEAEGIDISDEALREIARSGEGSMRDAQSNFDQVISFSGEKIGTEDVVTALGMASAEMLTKTLRAIADNKPVGVLEIVDELVGRGQDLRNFCRDMLAFFRDLLVVKLAGDSENLLDTAIVGGDELKTFADSFSEADLIRFFNSLCETELKLLNARQPRHLLEIGLVKLVEMRRVTPIEKLLERLARIENGIGANSSESADKSPAAPAAHSQAAAEKKTLTPELPAEEPASQPDFPTETLDQPPEYADFHPTDTEGEFDDADPEPETPEAGSSDFIEEFKANFVERLPPNSSPVTSEELEHIEDTWLDAEYENKLLRSGDDALWIPNASKIVSGIIGKTESEALPVRSVTHSGQSGTAYAAAREFADLEHEEEDDAIPPVLPENPTEEEVRHFAENHPLVKKVNRIFRGKIVEAKKTG